MRMNNLKASKRSETSEMTEFRSISLDHLHAAYVRTPTAVRVTTHQYLGCLSKSQEFSIKLSIGQDCHSIVESNYNTGELAVQQLTNPFYFKIEDLMST
jgi:hypothetical protein